MKKNRLAVMLALMLMAAGMLSSNHASAITKIEPDQKAVQLLNEFVRALSIIDDGERLKAVLPLVHKSLKNSNGSDLDGNVKPYSYKKAYQNVKFYKYPVEIYEVHQGNVTTVGYGPTAERGRTDKYFINKKEGVAGRPAPLNVFWPDGGEDPTIIYMGSL